jgi:hypothetical protein
LRAVLGKHGSARNQLALSETDLDALHQLWVLGEQKCAGRLRVSEPVRLLVEQLGRQPG